MLVSLAIAFALVPAAATQALADDDVTASGTCGDDLTWTLDSGGALTISGSGAMDDYSVSTQTGGSLPPWYGYTDTISSVTMPDSLTSIGAYAFRWCSSLTSVSIPDSVVTIGRNAFCVASLVSIEIPDSVITIGDYAFSSCTALESVSIGNSVTWQLGHFGQRHLQ